MLASGVASIESPVFFSTLGGAIALLSCNPPTKEAAAGVIPSQRSRGRGPGHEIYKLPGLLRGHPEPRHMELCYFRSASVTVTHVSPILSSSVRGGKVEWS